MLPLHMGIVSFLSHKLYITRDTCERLIDFMNHFMSLHFILASKRLPTVLTDKRPFSCVYYSMSCQLIFPCVCLTTNNAYIWTFSSVNSRVYPKSFWTEKSLATSITMEWKIICMCPNVILQFITTWENFPTDITDLFGVPTLTWKTQKSWNNSNCIVL